MLITALSACSDDMSEGDWAHYSDLGTVVATGDGITAPLLRMTRDDGAELIAVYSMADLSGLDSGQRIFCSYNLLSAYEGSDTRSTKAGGAYNIEVIGYDKVLTKEIITESFILADEDHRRDSIGNDPIGIYQARIGDDHLNIEFEYRRSSGSRTRHMVNLVMDDVASDGETIYLHFYHNAYGDTFENSQQGMVRHFGLASFPIKELFPNDAEKVMLEITFDHWESGSGTPIVMEYRLGESTNLGKPNNIGENIMMFPTGTVELIE